jgi:hypothetical protein
MATVPARATLDDLYRVEGKAELVGGRIIHPMASGHWPGRIAENIFVSLRLFTRKTGRGEAHADGVGYAVPELASGRESFAPDASYFEGLLPPGWMRFIAGAPRFAAEVRSEGDYGPGRRGRTGGQARGLFRGGDAGCVGRRSSSGNRGHVPSVRALGASPFSPGRNSGRGAGGSRLADRCR